MSHIGILGGWERDLDIIGVRALLGPAFYGGNGASGLGGEAEVDATAGFSHLAFVAVVRGSGIVRFTGESFRVASLQFGLRLR
jgi:hypothetical protein